jgi:hypothetical protein
VFVPSPDAAAKPLYPLLVASVHFLGIGWLTAAQVVTAVAGAATIALAFLVVLRLSGSWAIAAASAGLLLSSTTVAYWSGFSGPDPVAQALTLAAVLAFLERRPALGGVLLGLAIATRPEIAVLGIAAVVVFAWAPPHRRAMLRGVLACCATLVVVFGALRSPIALPDVKLLALAVLLAAVLVLAMRLELGGRRAPVAGACLLAALGFVFATSAGLRELWSHDWPLLGLGLLGAFAALLGHDGRRLALGALLAGALLSAVYWVKNPGLERYFAIVVPIACALLAAAWLVELARRRPGWVVPAAAGAVCVAALGTLGRTAPRYDGDVFSRTAARLAPALPPSSILVTAAPDAYSFWLPEQGVRVMRPGVRGSILLDPAQRAYAPDLRARGKVVSRIDSNFAFSRPDGEIDALGSTLVVGVVSRAPSAGEAQGGLP